MLFKTSTSLAAALLLLATLTATTTLDAQILTPSELARPTSVDRSAPATEPGQPAVRNDSPPTSTVGKELPFGNLMLVYFEEPGLAHYMGDVPGLEATSPVALGERKLDARSPASRAYLDYLEQRQNEYVFLIEQKLGRVIEPVFRYRAALSGIALKIDRAEGKLIESLPGVTHVFPDRVAYLDTDRGPLWIGADQIWDGIATGGLPGTQGEGIVAGIIDSGVNMDHPSFAETGGDGYTHTNPNGSGVFLGWCDPANPNWDPSYVCNDKLIGAWDYMDAYCAANPGVCFSEAPGPEDENGHGSHTASTVAGNVLLSPAISGVAPHANLITYDACYTNAQGQGPCPFTATSAAADQALLDGVDVVNYSIGGGSNPWGGDIDTYFLELFNIGTFVGASAGNSGPAASTVAHLGPWVTTSGASTHDRVNVFNELVDMTGGATSPPADIEGASRTGGYGPDTIVYAGDFANGDPNPEQCLNPFPAGTWTQGEIVLCDRGTIARVLKCAHVAAGGAAGCILGNVDGGAATIVADPHVIPAIHVDVTAGNALRSWLDTGAGHTGEITAAVIDTDPAVADIMASFSSRGPNLAFSVLKPDVTNPGVNIFAAVASGGELPPPEYGTISGTSMSSPHTTGSGALLKALYPSWSPAAIQSALMLTSDTTVLKEDGTTPAGPTEYGAGRVDLTKAALAGLILDETYENFVAADPATGGDPALLNRASLQQNNCVLTCTWDRTFTAPNGGANWNITFTTPLGVSMSADPSSFSVAAGGTQTVTFEIDASTVPLGQWTYAQANLAPNDGSPTLHMPVAAQIADNNLPASMNIFTVDEVGSQDLTGLQNIDAITELTTVEFGLTEGNLTEVELDEDPTNNSPYDNLSQVFWKVVSVPVGARTLIARTESAEAPDVDLFVGTGNLPTQATQQCASTTPTATESCEISSPSAGTWWILVQNWSGSAEQPDLIELLDGVVPSSDSGNMTVTGPATVAAGQPFDLNVAWNLTTTAEAGPPPSRFWFGAFSVAKDGVSPPIETIAVTLELDPDVIFYSGFENGTDGWSDVQD